MKIKSLKDLCFIEKSGVYGIPASAEDFDLNKTRYLRITDISEDGKLLNSDKKSVSDSHIEKYLLEEGDIVFARTGNSTGKSYYHENKNGQLAFAGFLIKFSLDPEKVIPKYLKYYTLTKHYKEWVKNFSLGSTRGNLNANSFGACPIPLPSREHQNFLIKILSDLDTKIDLNNKINEELESMVKLIYDYWFVQFDFPISPEYAESIGKPKLAGKPYKANGGKMMYNEQLKREIPKDWGSNELGSVVQFINRGISPSYTEKTGIPVINQKCIRSRSIDFKFSRLHDLDKKRTSKFIEIDDILINSTGVGTLGRSAIVKGLPKENVTVDSHVTIVRPDEAAVNTKFLGFSIIERSDEIEALGTGSTGQTELSRKNLEKLNVTIPERDYQERFAKIIKPVNERQALINKENQQLTELRDWLLPMLMNGQITVKDSYNKIDEQIDMAAEEETAYQRNSEFVDSLFEQINLYKEIAAIQLVEEETVGITHGKTGIQKTTSNLQQIFKEKRFKNVKYEERPWGMFSETIAENIEANPFLFKLELDSGKKVYRVKPEAKKELQTWIRLEENQDYIQSLRGLLTIYQEPFIKNDIYKIELLNTVYRCMSKLHTDNLDAIRSAMQNWPMIERKYKNKAEKFNESVTKKMIDFIRKKQLI